MSEHEARQDRRAFIRHPSDIPIRCVVEGHIDETQTALHDTSIVEKFGTLLNIHELVLEDVLNTAQGPTCEDHGDLIFIVVKKLHWVPEEDDVLAEHVAVLIGNGFVFSLQESEWDVFEAFRERIRTSTDLA